MATPLTTRCRAVDSRYCPESGTFRMSNHRWRWSTSSTTSSPPQPKAPIWGLSILNGIVTRRERPARSFDHRSSDFNYQGRQRYCRVVAVMTDIDLHPVDVTEELVALAAPARMGQRLQVQSSITPPLRKSVG